MDTRLRMTDLARRVVSSAERVAWSYHHPYVGTEHLLIALVEEPDGTPAKALSALRAEPPRLRGFAEKVMAFPDPRHRGPIEKTILSTREDAPHVLPKTPALLRAMTGAYEEAAQLGSRWIGTGHLLLGLIRDDKGLAYNLLRGAFRLNPVILREEIIDQLSQVMGTDLDPDSSE